MEDDPLIQVARDPSPTRRGLSLRAMVIVGLALVAVLVLIFVLALS